MFEFGELIINMKMLNWKWSYIQWQNININTIQVKWKNINLLLVWNITYVQLFKWPPFEADNLQWNLEQEIAYQYKYSPWSIQLYHFPVCSAFVHCAFTVCSAFVHRFCVHKAFTIHSSHYHSELQWERTYCHCEKIIKGCICKSWRK